MPSSDAKRRGREKLRESLLLAGEDMTQAHAAAKALRTDQGAEEAWRRALETAMAVSYMRPFTRGAWTLPPKYQPTSTLEKQLHGRLSTLRNKVYAHSDHASGRSASLEIQDELGEFVIIRFQTEWEAFPVSDLLAIEALCKDQMSRFQEEAIRIHLELEEPNGAV